MLGQATARRKSRERSKEAIVLIARHYGDACRKPRPGMAYVNPTGEFTRDQRYIATRITADGRDG